MGLAGGIIGASLGTLVVVGVSAAQDLDAGAGPAGSRSARRCSARSSACCPAPIPRCAPPRWSPSRRCARAPERCRPGDEHAPRLAPDRSPPSAPRSAWPPAVAAAAPGAARTSGTSVQQPSGDVEDQLGFDQAGDRRARQSRVEAGIRDCMKAQGFDYVPVDPVAQRAAADRREPPERRGLPQAVRLRDQHALGPRRRRRPTPTSAAREPRPRGPARLRPGARGARTRGATFQDAVDTGDFTKLGGCTLQGDREPCSAAPRC